MASLYNNKISTTYVGLIKTIDNAVISASLKELTDGSGNATGLYVNTAGDFKVTSILEFGSLKDTGEGITITKFVDEADGIASNDNDTTIPTSAAVVDYVASRITLEDLDFSGDSGTGSVDLDSQVFAIVGTTNEIETSGGSQQLQIGLPTNITIAGTTTFGGNLIGNTNIILKDTSDNTLAAFYSGGKGEIYFNNSKKFETTSDGVTVTGGLTATGGSVFTGASFSSDITLDDGSGASPNLKLINESDEEGTISINSSGKIEIATGGTARQTISSGDTEFSGNIILLDSKNLKLGAGQDLELFHNGTDSYIQNSTGHLNIINYSDDKSIYFQTDDGSGGVTNYMKIDGVSEYTQFDKAARMMDSVNLQFGNSNDAQIYHNGTADGGTWYFITQTDNGYIDFRTDDGSGGTTSYLVIDGSNEVNRFYKRVQLEDNVKLTLGNVTTPDLEIYHDGSDSYIADTGTGDLIISGSNDVIIKDSVGNLLFNGNASDSVELYYGGSKKFETTSGGIQIHSNINMNDNGHLYFGASNDLDIYHDAGNSYIKDSGTGNLKIQASTEINLQATSGESFIDMFENGAVTLYYDNSSKLSTSATGIAVTGGITTDGASTFSASVDITGNTTFYSDGLFTDNKKLKFGTSGDLEIYHDGSNSYISDTGSLRITTTYLSIQSETGEVMADFDNNNAVSLYYDNSKKFETTSTGVSVTGDADVSGLVKVGGDDTEYANNYLRFKSVGAGFIDHNTVGQSLKFRLSNSSSLDIVALEITPSYASFAGNLTVSGDFTVNGTTTTVNTDHFNVEDPLISMAKDNAANTVDIGTYGRYNDGTQRYLGLFSDASDSNTFKLFKGLTVEPTTTVDTTATGYTLADLDAGAATFAGTITVGADLIIPEYIYHTGNLTTLFGFPSDNTFKIKTNNADALTIDSSQDASFTGDVSLADSKYAVWGDGSDFKIHHNGTDTYLQNYTGDLYIRNEVDDKDILFQCDDGTGGVAEYFRLHGAAASAPARYTAFPNDSYITFGNSKDLELFWSTNGVVRNQTGDLYIDNYQDDGDIKFRADDGSGSNAEYFRLDGGVGSIVVSQPMQFGDSISTYWGASDDLQIYHDGSNSYIKDGGVGNLYIRATNFALQSAAGTDDYITTTENAEINLFYNNSKKLETTTDGIKISGINANNKVESYFDGDYTSGFKFSDLNGGIWYDAGTDDLTVSAGHANSEMILISGGLTTLTLSAAQLVTFAGNVNMTSGDIDYVSQLHFADNVRLVDNGNDSDLNFRYGDTTFGHFRFIDGSDTYKGGVYAESGYIGTLSPDGSWAVQSSNTITNISHGLNVNGGHINIDAGMSFQWDDSHERIEQSDGKIEFFTNNSESMVLSGSDLGIGTDSPIEKLQVAGQIISTGSNVTSATAGAERAIMDLSSNIARMGHFRGTEAAGSGQLKLYTDSVERVRIDASGNVGIGTDSPDTKLEVEVAGTAITRTTMTAADGYRGGFEASNTHTGGTIWSMFSTNNSDSYFGGGKFVIGNETMADVDASTAAKVVIDGTGNVGINTNTPAKKLDVARTATSFSGASTDEGAVIRLTNPSNWENGYDGNGFVGGIEFYTADTSESGPAVFGAIKQRQLSYYNDQAMCFFTSPYNGSLTERMRIDASGYIGIGSGSPSSYNSRGKDLVIKKTGSDVGISIIAEISGATEYSSSIMFGDGTSGTAAYRGSIEYDHADDSMTFSTAATEGVRITSAGRVNVKNSISQNNNGVIGHPYTSGTLADGADITINVNSSGDGNNSIGFIAASCVPNAVSTGGAVGLWTHYHTQGANGYTQLELHNENNITVSESGGAITFDNQSGATAYYVIKVINMTSFDSTINAY